MIDFVLFAVIFWIVAVMVVTMSEDATRQVDTLLELDAEHKARVDAEAEYERRVSGYREGPCENESDTE